MMELSKLVGTLFSNTVEIHSFELGVQLTVLTIFIMYYSSQKIGGVFLASMIGSVFVLQPIMVVEEKPWYFLTGVLAVLFGIELFRYYRNNFSLFKKTPYSLNLKQTLSRIWR